MEDLRTRLETAEEHAGELTQQLHTRDAQVKVLEQLAAHRDASVRDYVQQLKV